MSAWNSGYVDEIEYTYGYYTELNPDKMLLPFLNYGIEPPKVINACELGFGQGVSINFHSTGRDVNWFGNDFNPNQAHFAQRISKQVENNALLTDESFETFCMRDDIPNFDFIALHGIWSWISDKNRQVIVDFINRKLNVGGVVYISYNTLPGWAGFSPVRHLMKQHTSQFGAPAENIEKRITNSIDFVEKLFDVKSKFTEQTFASKERFERIKNQDKSYLAHEYFNRDWKPMYFQEMQDWLSEAKLDYVCSANYLDAIDAINLTQEQQELLNSIENLGFRETLRDYLTNQQFRKDYWIKGKRNLSKFEKIEKLNEIKVMLSVGNTDAPKNVTGSLGEAKLQVEVYQAVLNVLKDRKPHSIAEIYDTIKTETRSLEMILQTVFVLIALGNVSRIPDGKIDPSEVKKLNAMLINMSKYSPKVPFLLSPVTGNAVTITRFNQLFIDALQNGSKTAEQIAKHVCNILYNQNQKIIKNGKTLESYDANLKELTEQAEQYMQSDYISHVSLQII